MNQKNYKALGVVLISVALVAIIFFGRALNIPGRVRGRIKALNTRDINVYEEKIDIEGLEEPFVIYYVADSHISLCDYRDKEIMQICSERKEYFKRDAKSSDKNFSLVMDYIRKDNPDLVIFGGDMTDEASFKSIEYVEKEISKLECPYLFCMGNHDFMYGNEYFSEEAYTKYFTRFDSLNEVKEGVQIVGYDSFNIVLLDDCNNQVCPQTRDAIAKLRADGKPVIMAQHVPFVPTYGDSDLIEKTNETWGTDYIDYSKVLMGEHANKPNEYTAELIDFVENDNLVKLVLAGHIHFYHRDYMREDAIQVTTPPAYERGLIKITLY